MREYVKCYLCGGEIGEKSPYFQTAHGISHGQCEREKIWNNFEAEIVKLRAKNRIYKKQIKQMNACIGGTQRALRAETEMRIYWQNQYGRIHTMNTVGYL
jgi:hypothetical protein